jgi:hypothetical protein
MEISGELHAPAAYPQGNSPWYPLDRGLGGLQSRSERSGEDINSHLLSGLEPLINQPVAQRYNTELRRLIWKRCTKQLHEQKEKEEEEEGDGGMR